MKPSDCCRSCSLTRLSFLIAGHIVAREVEVNYDTFMTPVLEAISQMTPREMDKTFDLFTNCDTVTKLIAGVKVNPPGPLGSDVPQCIANVFRNNLNNKRFCNAWPRMKEDGFVLFTPRDFEEFLREDNIEDLPDKITLLAPVIEKDLYDFIRKARKHKVPGCADVSRGSSGRVIVCAEDTVLYNKKMRQWEIEFVHDIGRSFTSAPKDFMLFQHFFDDRESSMLYRTPNLARILTRLDDDGHAATAYADCGALRKILAVAELMANLHSPDTPQLTRAFEGSNPPVLGLLSRYPSRLIHLEKPPKTGITVTNNEGSLIYNNGAFYIIKNNNPTEVERKNPSITFTKIAHGILAAEKTKEMISGGVPINKRLRMRLKSNELTRASG